MEKRVKILVIDDEPEFLLALQRALEAKSLHVITASNKAEAQETIKIGDPALIILGTITPRGDAFSLHKWLKQHPRFKDLPTVVMDAPLEKRLVSGWSMDEGVQMEADEYLTKPIEPTSLVPLVQALLERAVRRIKVLIVDDHTVIRDGIRAMLMLQKDIMVVGEAVNGKEAVEKTLQLLPDVVVMDIVMPEMNGLEATKQIYKERPQTKVLMLTQYDDEENILTSDKVGACGFISKTGASSQLIAGIRAVSRGEHFKPPITV